LVYDAVLSHDVGALERLAESSSLRCRRWLRTWGSESCWRRRLHSKAENGCSSTTRTDYERIEGKEGRESAEVEIGSGEEVEKEEKNE